MQNQKWRKKGFTLIELTVVIAVLAIISTVIVAFSSLVSAQVTRSNARADFLKHAASLKSDLQTAFAEFDAPNTTFNVAVDNENNVISFSFNANQNGESQTQTQTQTFSFADYGEFTFSVFVQEQDEQGASAGSPSLLKCVMKNQSLGVKQTFLISSRCGAAFAVSQNAGGGA